MTTTGFTPSQPEKEQVVLELVDEGIEVKEFTEYSFNSNFLVPTDGWSFTAAAERLSDKMLKGLEPGGEVRLTLNGIVQATGYIDSIEISASRGQGTIWRIEGRDKLGQVVDAHADPTKSFKEGQSLEDALVSLFKPFGWDTADKFVETNEKNRNIKTGGIRGKTKTSEAKGFGRRAIRQEKLHQLRPYPKEGTLEFAHRISQRFGLWIWLSADGEQVIVSRPDFEQEPRYKLIRNYEGTTNVLDGTVKYCMTDQPTVIMADSYAHNGEFGLGRNKTIMYNSAIYTEDPEFVDLYKRYPEARQIIPPVFPRIMKVRHNRPLFLHDDESQTQEQLDNFVRREMALLQRKSLTANYVVEGHGQTVNGDFVPWTVDTTVAVEDDIAGLTEVLYVLSRTFNKSRNGGTTTHLELVRLHSIEFGQPIKEAPKAVDFPKKAKRERPFIEVQRTRGEGVPRR